MDAVSRVGSDRRWWTFEFVAKWLSPEALNLSRVLLLYRGAWVHYGLTFETVLVQVHTRRREIRAHLFAVGDHCRPGHRILLVKLDVTYVARITTGCRISLVNFDVTYVVCVTTSLMELPVKRLDCLLTPRTTGIGVVATTVRRDVPCLRGPKSCRSTASR